MMASEAAGQHSSSLENELHALELQQAAEQADDTALLSTQQARLEELRASRNDLAASISAPSLTKYEQLRRTKAGVAMAHVRLNVCTGCHVTLTPANLQRARNSADLVTCDNCGRILALS